MHYICANTSLILGVDTALGRDITVLPESITMVWLVIYVLPLSDVGWTGSSVHTLVDSITITIDISTCTPGAVSSLVQIETTCCRLVDC